jgi:hypothetical protein
VNVVVGVCAHSFTIPTVVPAKAGTYNHRQLLFGELLPHVADTLRNY